VHHALFESTSRKILLEISDRANDPILSHIISNGSGVVLRYGMCLLATFDTSEDASLYASHIALLFKYPLNVLLDLGDSLHEVSF